MAGKSITILFGILALVLGGCELFSTDVADIEQGRYSHLVMVTNYDHDKIAPQAQFVFEVVER